MKRPDVDWPESLQILTTRRDPPTLTTTNATSAATAEAAHPAATVAAEYPGFWPEAARGLLVHSARWTPQMETQLGTAGGSRRMRANIIRRYGFGVPTAERAMRSATDALTLIMQDTIHPFRLGALRELHLHDLPWPRDELAGLGEVPVAMRVTLSYFVEPSPTRRGFRRRYRAAAWLMMPFPDARASDPGLSMTSKDFWSFSSSRRRAKPSRWPVRRRRPKRSALRS